MFAWLIASCAAPQKLDLFNNRDCNIYGQSFCTRAIGDGVYISNGPDFLIYNFHFDERNVLAIYEGGHAQQFGPENYSSKQVGKAIVRYREYDDGETFHRYYVNDTIERPKILHMMSPIDLTERQQSFVSRALSTLRYCRPSGASMICDAGGK